VAIPHRAPILRRTTPHPRSPQLLVAAIAFTALPPLAGASRWSDHYLPRPVEDTATGRGGLHLRLGVHWTIGLELATTVPHQVGRGRRRCRVKCFMHFKLMFQVFHLDIAKVDLGCCICCNDNIRML
jgi:hypothetical protein